MGSGYFHPFDLTVIPAIEGQSYPRQPEQRGGTQMEPLTTYRLTIHLDNGKSLETEESLSSEEFEAQTEVVERIEDREEPWKTFGHLVVNFRQIVAVEVEALGEAA